VPYFTARRWSALIEFDRAALAYLPAQILYKHGHFEEASARCDVRR
jgi:hypothetical protein